MSERDLFRAIVISGVALVTAAPGCSCATTPLYEDAATPDVGTDAAVMAVDAGTDAPVVIADAGTDAAPLDDAAEGDTGMVLIL